MGYWCQERKMKEAPKWRSVEHQKTEGEKSLKLPDQQNNIVKIQSAI